MYGLDDIALYTGFIGGMYVLGAAAETMINNKKNKGEKLASGEFGTEKDLKDLLGADGIQISKNIRLSLKASHEGVCIIGPTGSKKSSSIMASNLLNEELIPGSFVISDPKGELWRICSNYLRYKGYMLSMFNPTSPLNSIQYNPLEMCRTSE